MTPKPYSDKSSLPIESLDDVASGIPNEIIPHTPTPETLSGATTPSPTPQDQLPVETFADTMITQHCNTIPELSSVTPCYPTPGDIMPYDHSLPDFIRQITNEPNLANLQSLSLRVISTLISLHRMTAYLPNLRELNLEGSVLNSLRDIGCSLKNLQILKVGRCQLESLDGTFGLSSLRELHAQKNLINDMSPCSNLPHIRHIDVSWNRIRNISYAGFLSVCSKLKSIVITGNPASEAPDYRKRVHRILPQIETLDGVAFTDEENIDKTTVLELENSYDETYTGLLEAPGFVAVSRRDGVSYILESGERELTRSFISHQESELVDRKIPEVANDFQLVDDFQNLAKVEITEQARSIDNININLKQKSTGARKLDKDIENRSKKLLINGTLGEQSFFSYDLPESSHSGGNSVSPSSSTSVERSSGLGVFPSMGRGPEETTETVLSLNFSVENKSGETKFSKTSSAVPKYKGKDEEQITNQNWGLNKLTTGLPVCGNLTAALRSRKKIQNARIETQSFTSHKIKSSSKGDEADLKDITCSEDDTNERDISVTCGKWEKSFYHQRAGWKDEEDEEEAEEKFH